MLRPIATWLLIFSPLAMMLIFALSAFYFIGPIAILAIAIACIPYLILSCGAIAIRFWTRPTRGPLLFVIPALLLAALHAFTVLDHLQTVRASAARPPGSRPESVSPEQVTAALIAASGAVLVIITGIWSVLVLPISAFLAAAPPASSVPPAPIPAPASRRTQNAPSAERRH